MKLIEVIHDATQQCRDEIEEEGGIIIHNPSVEDSYEFIKLTNQNTGKALAPVLWTADQQEYADKILPRVMKGERHFASFHTHPRFLAIPSTIDLSQLFPGFSINMIYSQTTNRISVWETDKEFHTTFSTVYEGTSDGLVEHKDINAVVA